MASNNLLGNGSKEHIQKTASATIYCYLDKSKKFPWLMYFTGITANLLLITSGICSVWMSPVLPKLQSNDTNVNPLENPITVTQTSILATVSQIGAPIGLIVSAKLAGNLGRKITLMIVAITFIFLFSIMAVIGNIYIYFICKFISGICLYCSIVTVSVFNNEIAEDKNRGIMGCIMGLNIPFGQLLGNVLGPMFSVKIFSLICFIPCLLYLVFFIIIPESPVFLALKGKKIESMKSLEKLRRCKDINEYIKIEKNILATNALQKRTFLDLFRNPVARKALFISIGLFIIHEFTGIFVLLTFLGSMFKSAGSVSGNIVGIVFGTVHLIIIIIAIFLVDYLGRRKLLLISSITCAISLFFIGCYFYLLKSNSVLLDNIGWLPLVSIIMYITGYGLGLGPIPIPMVGELFTSDLKATAIAATLFIDNLLIFSMKFSYPFLSVYIGTEYCMWFYGGSCFLGFIWIYFVVPETKGKSCLEIQKILEK